MKNTLSKIDELIRTARVREARRELSRFRTEKVPRECVLPLAKYCRSANLPELGLHLLNPVVRPSAKSVITATDSEKAVYSACLIRIGAAGEALAILRALNSEKVPECLLYEAYALVSQWNYRDSIPVLKRYIRNSSLDAYQKAVGRVNLAAAYVHERASQEASFLLSQLRDETKGGKYLQLYGNTLELSAQLAILTKKWMDAEGFLSEARQTLKASGGLDSFFVQKWQAIMAVLKFPKDLRPLHRIKKEASQLKHWETIRDCDRFACLAQQNEELFQLLYFGTPYQEFRSQLSHDFKGSRLPDSFTWYPNQIQKGPTLDLVEFQGVNNTKSGMLLHRLLQVLSSDFYRPIRLATIHSVLYEGEHFNPRSSPTRVHQAIKRLRQWLKKSIYPLEIHEDHSSYALKALAPVGVRVSLHENLPTRQDLLLGILKEKWGKEPFGVRDVAERLRISLRSANRILKVGETSGHLVREGKASATKYRF